MAKENRTWGYIDKLIFIEKVCRISGRIGQFHIDQEKAARSRKQKQAPCRLNGIGGISQEIVTHRQSATCVTAVGKLPGPFCESPAAFGGLGGGYSLPFTSCQPG